MVWIILIVAVAILWLIKQHHNSSLTPPGPKALPFIGNLLQLRSLPHLKLTEWSRTFGSIMSVYIGNHKVYVLSDPALIRKVFDDSKFAGRFQPDLLNLVYKGNYGITFREGKHVQEQRKFAVRKLRQLGVGTRKTQDLILHEIQQFFNSLDKIESTPVNIAAKFPALVVNALWTIVAGERYDHEDPKINRVIHALHEMDQKAVFSIPFFWPQLGQFFPKTWKVVTDFISLWHNFAHSHIFSHRENPPADGVASDFLHAYFQEIGDTLDPDSSFHSRHGIKFIRGTVMDMLMGGSDTTSGALAWLVLYLCKHPEIQRKLQTELDSVAGNRQQVTLSDRPLLSYTDAVIHETLRIAPPLPLAIFHAAMEDGSIAGYPVPRGTWVVGNIYGAHHRKDMWGDPEIFRPERFLAEGHQTLVKHKAFMPFSAGKRNCIGESLARDTLFLVTANLFKRFEIDLAGESLGVSYEHKGGISIAPQEYQVVLRRRE